MRLPALPVKPRSTLVLPTALLTLLLLLWSGGVAGAAPYSDVVFADNPVSYWRLGDSAGATANDIAGGRNGSYNGSAALNQQGAIVGDADGAMGVQSGGRMTVPHDAALNTGTFSIELWAQLNTNPNAGAEVILTTRVGHFNGYNFAFGGQSVPEDDPNLVFYLGTGSAWEYIGWTPSTTVEYGAWNHIVGTFEGTTARLFLNGEEAASGTVSTYTTSLGGELALGGWGGSFDMTNGFIDEVAYYNYALGADRVENHYLTGIGVIPEPNTALLLGMGLVGLSASNRRRASR